MLVDSQTDRQTDSGFLGLFCSRIVVVSCCAALIAGFRRIAALTRDTSLVMEAVLANPYATPLCYTTSHYAVPSVIPAPAPADVAIVVVCVCFRNRRGALELRLGGLGESKAGHEEDGKAKVCTTAAAEGKGEKNEGEGSVAAAAASALAQQPVIRSTDPAM